MSTPVEHADTVSTLRIPVASPAGLLSLIDATGTAPRKKLVPKPSILASFVARLAKDKESETATPSHPTPALRVSADTPVVKGEATVLVMRPEDDPDIGEIVVVKRRKSRAALNSVRWDDASAESAVDAQQDREEEKHRGAQKWWNIGRGKKELKQRKSEFWGSTGAAVLHASGEAGGSGSSGTDRRKSFDAYIPPASRVVRDVIYIPDDHHPAENGAHPDAQCKPLMANGGGESMAIRAIRSMRSLAKMASWVNSKGDPETSSMKTDREKVVCEDSDRGQVAKSKAKQPKVERERGTLKKRDAKGTVKKIVKKEKTGSICSLTTEAVGTGDSVIESRKTLVRKKSSIGVLARKLSSTLRMPSTRQQSMASSVFSPDDRLRVLPALTERPSTRGSLRPVSMLSTDSVASGRSVPKSVRWDEEGLEQRRKEREAKRRSVELGKERDTTATGREAKKAPATVLLEDTNARHQTEQTTDRQASTPSTKKAKQRPSSAPLPKTNILATIDGDDGFARVLDAATRNLVGLVDTVPSNPAAIFAPSATVTGPSSSAAQFEVLSSIPESPSIKGASPPQMRQRSSASKSSTRSTPKPRRSKRAMATIAVDQQAAPTDVPPLSAAPPASSARSLEATNPPASPPSRSPRTPRSRPPVADPLPTEAPSLVPGTRTRGAEGDIKDKAPVMGSGTVRAHRSSSAATKGERQSASSKRVRRSELGTTTTTASRLLAGVLEEPDIPEELQMMLIKGSITERRTRKSGKHVRERTGPTGSMSPIDEPSSPISGPEPGQVVLETKPSPEPTSVDIPDGPRDESVALNKQSFIKQLDDAFKLPATVHLESNDTPGNGPTLHGFPDDMIESKANPQESGGSEPLAPTAEPRDFQVVTDQCNREATNDEGLSPVSCEELPLAAKEHSTDGSKPVQDELNLDSDPGEEQPLVLALTAAAPIPSFEPTQPNPGTVEVSLASNKMSPTASALTWDHTTPEEPFDRELGVTGQTSGPTSISTSTTMGDTSTSTQNEPCLKRSASRLHLCIPEGQDHRHDEPDTSDTDALVSSWATFRAQIAHPHKTRHCRDIFVDSTLSGISKTQLDTSSTFDGKHPELDSTSVFTSSPTRSASSDALLNRLHDVEGLVSTDCGAELLDPILSEEVPSGSCSLSNIPKERGPEELFDLVSESGCLIFDAPDTTLPLDERQVKFPSGHGARPRSSTGTSMSEAETPPLSEENSFTLSEESHAALDFTRLDTILFSATGHARFPTRTNVERSLKEDDYTTNSSDSPTLLSKEIHNPTQSQPILVYYSEMAMVDGEPNTTNDGDGGVSMHKYFAFKDEAEEIIVESRRLWQDTPFSTFALQSFEPPRKLSSMQEELEESIQQYGPLPHELRDRARRRNRTISRPTPYPARSPRTSLAPDQPRPTLIGLGAPGQRTPKTSMTSSLLRPSLVIMNSHPPRSAGSSPVDDEPIRWSFDDIKAKHQPPRAVPLQTLPVNPNLCESATAASFPLIKPFSPVVMDALERKLGECPAGTVRPRATSGTHQTVKGRSKKSTGKTKTSNGKENLHTGLGQSTTTGPAESLKIKRPRPRGRLIAASTRPSNV